MVKPKGVLLNRHCQIGEKLGSGACGSVHELVKIVSGSSSGICSNQDFVVKLAPLAPPAKSGKRRKKSAIERNSDLLYYEHNLYCNIFNELQGKILPNVPQIGGKIPLYGDVDGFRYLVMERMQHSLSDVISILADESRNKSKIQLGQVAAALISLLEAVHEKQRLFVDVKSENFMICRKSKDSSSIAKRIRMIDLGLVESFHDVSIGGHRQNLFPNGPMVGTPTYASINVLEGNTASRRDDLEAVGYVIVELILFAHQKYNGLNSNVLLPWSVGKSDDDILRLKRDSLEGSLFDQIGKGNNKESSLIMKEYFLNVRGMTYKEKPDYEKLKSLVLRLTIRIGNQNATIDMNLTKTTTRKQRRKKSPKASPEEKIVRKTTRSSKTLYASDSDDSSTNSPAKASVIKPKRRITRTSARAAAAAKEIESLKIKKKRARRLEIVIESESDEINSDHDNPSPPKMIKTFSQGDEFHSASDNEKETDFTCKKQGSNFETHLPIDNVIFPLSSSSRSRLNIESHEDDFLSVCDETIDLTSTCHKNFDDETTFQSCHSSPESMDWEYVADEDDAPCIDTTNKENEHKTVQREKKRVSSKHLLLSFIEGPHVGKSFELHETINIGKNPPKSRSKKVSLYKIENDPQVSQSHAQLILNKTKHGALSVRVKDLGSSNGTFVNGKAIPTKGQLQAFSGSKIQIGQSVLKIEKVKK